MIIFGREISPKFPPFIIAEISCNHEGKIEDALNLIKDAKYAGADAVKVQCYSPDEITIDHKRYVGPQDNYEMPTEFYYDRMPWKGQHLYDLYKRTQTPPAWMPELFNYAKTINMPIFASVFGDTSLAALEAVGCEVYKIASFEANDTNLLEKVAATGKPVIISTGAVTDKELDRAVNTIGKNFLVMHCVSKYPTSFKEAELTRITQFRRNYGSPIGYSDHTQGSRAAQMAVALGACIIEKHFGGSDKSADAEFSTNKHGFRLYVDACKDAWEATQLGPIEISGLRRSLYVVKDIKEGEKFTEEHIRSIRPGYGLDPDLLTEVLNKKAKFNLLRGTALKEDMIA